MELRHWISCYFVLTGWNLNNCMGLVAPGMDSTAPRVIIHLSFYSVFVGAPRLDAGSSCSAFVPINPQWETARWKHLLCHLLYMRSNIRLRILNERSLTWFKCHTQVVKIFFVEFLIATLNVFQPFRVSKDRGASENCLKEKKQKLRWVQKGRHTDTASPSILSAWWKVNLEFCRLFSKWKTKHKNKGVIMELMVPEDSKQDSK